MMPTWRPTSPPIFDIDTEAERITSEVWSASPRPERVVVNLGDHQRVVGVPATDDRALLRAWVAEALRELAEEGV